MVAPGYVWKHLQTDVDYQQVKDINVILNVKV